MARPAHLMIALGLFLGLATAASAHSFEANGLTITHPWARATPPGVPTGAVYFVVTSDGVEDTLLGAASPVAGRATLHRTIVEDGQSRMVPVERVTVGPDQPIAFQPGGYHLMLMPLKRPLEEGQSFPLTLRLKKAGEIRVEVAVRPITATGGGMNHGAMKSMDQDMMEAMDQK